MAWTLRLRIVLCAVWAVALVSGGYVVFRYQSSRGAVGTAPERWPASAQIPLEPQHSTLIFFAHPKCPCTRASLEELNCLLPRTLGRMSTHVVFVRPRSVDDQWSKTDLWKKASALPGVKVHEDVDGALAQLFGAETSGQVFLYDPQGVLVFQGGITAGRGHIGTNLGAEAVVALSTDKQSPLHMSPVYGCSIRAMCDTLGTRTK